VKAARTTLEPTLLEGLLASETFEVGAGLGSTVSPDCFERWHTLGLMRGSVAMLSR
jgi:hypothetical protein